MQTNQIRMKLPLPGQIVSELRIVLQIHREKSLYWPCRKKRMPLVLSVNFKKHSNPVRRNNHTKSTLKFGSKTFLVTLHFRKNMKIFFPLELTFFRSSDQTRDK